MENNIFTGYNIIDYAQKRGLMLSFGGDNVNDMFDNFDLAEYMPAPQLIAKLAKCALIRHFYPRNNTEYQRFLFRHTDQESDKVNDFVGTLRQLHVTCNYADPDSAMKPQIISG